MPPVKSAAKLAEVAAAALPTAPYVTLERVLHNGKDYPKGNTIHLNVNHASKLLKTDSVMAIKSDTTAEDANRAIDLKQLSQAQLVEHATEVYHLNLPAESTTEALIGAITNAQAAQVGG